MGKLVYKVVLQTGIKGEILLVPVFGYTIRETGRIDEFFSSLA